MLFPIFLRRNSFFHSGIISKLFHNFIKVFVTDKMTMDGILAAAYLIDADTFGAADVKFCDRSGKVISTKIVACKAQDLGFTGIANIDKTYTAIHLDVRTSGKWYGDEVKGTSSSVTSDFYAYYGISRSSEAVRKLQTILNGKGAKLTVDGIAGTKTLAAVKKYIIDKGDSGPLTKWVQQRMNALGYGCGTPDGIAGDKTMPRSTSGSPTTTSAGLSRRLGLERDDEITKTSPCGEVHFSRR